jgi:hypothetical protein
MWWWFETSLFSALALSDSRISAARNDEDDFESHVQVAFLMMKVELEQDQSRLFRLSTFSRMKSDEFTVFFTMKNC